MPTFATVLAYNENAPGGVGSTLRGLTHSLDLGKEGLGMEPTQVETKTCDNCGAVFSRHKRDWPGRWAARRFCSKRCAVRVGSRIAAEQRRKGNPGDLEKECSSCKITKSLGDFTISKKGPLGRASRCRACQSATSRGKYQEGVQAIREAEKATGIRWVRRRKPVVYGCDPEPTEKRCTSCDEVKPLEMFAKGRAKYGRQQHCRPCVAAYKIRYQAAHPETGWLGDYRRRAKRCGVEPVVERFTRAEVIDTYGDRCAYCKVGGFEQLDHYVPVAAGGAHVLANVRPTCESCNHKKNVAHGDEFEAAS